LLGLTTQQLRVFSSGHAVFLYGAQTTAYLPFQSWITLQDGALAVATSVAASANAETGAAAAHGPHLVNGQAKPGPGP
jgi:hypothetical protein